MPFEKGHKKPGPGRPKLYNLEKGNKMFNQLDLLRHCNDLIQMGQTELLKVAKDPDQPVIRVAVASILLHGIKKGDQARIEMILNRMVGKVKDIIDLSSSDGTMATQKQVDVSKLSEEDLQKLRGILKKAQNV
jgi:hypothetical protein